jgi:hypothetical protein
VCADSWFNDDGRRIDTRRRMHGELSGAFQTAPTGSVRIAHNHVGQACQATIRNPPLQALRQRRGGAGRIAKPPSRRCQS